jgi:hypothetical protein
MNEASYPFKRIEDRVTFSFESISEEKTIQKLVEFRLFDDANELYNLALMDVLAEGNVSDLTVSNNLDSSHLQCELSRCAFVTHHITTPPPI